MAELANEIEQIFKLQNREIWIVTAAAGERRGGLVATWVLQASIDLTDPLVIAGLAPNHFTTELATASGALAVHLLAPSQLDLVWRFGLGSGRDRDKFAGLTYTVAKTGAPILADALAWLDCRVLNSYDGGDRLFLCGQVVAAGRRGTGPVMTERELVAGATSEQLAALRQDREHDIQIQRPLRAQWRKQQGLT